MKLVTSAGMFSFSIALLACSASKPDWQKTYESLDPFNISHADLRTLNLLLAQEDGTEAIIAQASLYLCGQSEKYVTAGEILLCARNDLILKETHDPITTR